MSVKSKFISFVFFLLLIGNNAFAQAIKLTFLESNEVAVEGTANLSLGIGYEQNLHKRISVLINGGLVYSSENTSIYNYRTGFYQYDNDTTNIDFSREHTAFKLTFESRYFFRDNDEGSWYIASKISFQSRKETTTILAIGPSSNPQNSFHDIEVSGKYSQSLLITPLSITMGHRSSLEGFIFDINLGYAFLPKNVFALSIPTGSVIEKSVTFNKSLFTFGMSIGFGWANN